MIENIIRSLYDKKCNIKKKYIYTEKSTKIKLFKFY